MCHIKTSGQLFGNKIEKWEMHLVRTVRCIGDVIKTERKSYTNTIFYQIYNNEFIVKKLNSLTFNYRKTPMGACF